MSMHGITLMTHLNGKLGLVNEVKAWDMVAVTMKEGGTVELFYCSNLKKEATSAPAAPASFGDFGAAASNGFMDKANRMFGCGRMFQSPPTFNEKPKFMSPGPKFGCGAAASNADRIRLHLRHPSAPAAPATHGGFAFGAKSADSALLGRSQAYGAWRGERATPGGERGGRAAAAAGTRSVRARDGGPGEGRTGCGRDEARRRRRRLCECGQTAWTAHTGLVALPAELRAGARGAERAARGAAGVAGGADGAHGPGSWRVVGRQKG